MTQYDNTNRGVLFRNEEKENEKHADYRGNINIEGKEYWLDSWLRKSKAGKTFMSLSVKPKLARDHEGGAKNPPAQKGKAEEFNDDIPF